MLQCILSMDLAEVQRKELDVHVATWMLHIKRKKKLDAGLDLQQNTK